MSNDTEGGASETPTVEDLQARLAKAEWKIVEMKKSNKSTTEETTDISKGETTTPNFGADDFDKRYEERKFFETNPDLSEYKEQLNEYVSKGLTFNDAKVLLEKNDQTINNRKTTKQANFTTGDVPVDKQNFSMDQLWDMSQWDYNKAMDLVDSGKAKVSD